jgi:nucleoid-associated protein YgaU
MRQEWLMVLLVGLLFVTVGCGPTAKASAVQGEESSQAESLSTSETYTVQAGDTLMGISRKFFDGDPQYWDEIAELNDIKAPDYAIYPGKELKLPKLKEGEAARTVTSQGVTSTGAGDSGLSDSATQTVQVSQSVSDNQPPKAVIIAPTSGRVGEALSFSGAGSTDDGRIVSYVWDFGDGTTGSGEEVTHSYSAAGSYKVTLTVTDDSGLSDTGPPHTILPAEASTTSTTYKVQSGDCLMGIARKLLGDPHRWREIANLNGIGPPYTVYIGQELEVPEK